MGFIKVKLQKGLVKHEPPKTYGDCHRAAVAMVLGEDISTIPHFFDKPETTWDVFLEWAEDNNIDMINFAFDGKFPIKDIMSTLNFSNRDRPYILGCRSTLGCDHSVVCQGTEIFDPSPVDSGVDGPMSDGTYRITYLIK